MNVRHVLFAALAGGLVAAPSLSADPADTFGASTDRVRADVTFLADDLLLGRQAGTPSYDIAAAYVASRFQGLGLKPAGTDGSWYQPLTLRKATLDAQRSSVALVQGDMAETLDDAMARPRPSLSDPDVTLDAPLVFAGYGLDAPSLGYDDYAGIDASGKIVVVIDALPKGLSPAIKGHLDQSRTTVAAAHGAVGFIAISPAEADRAKRMYDYFGKAPRRSWVAEDGRNGALPVGMKLSIMVSPDGAARIMRGGRVPLDRLMGLARDGAKLSSFDLPGRIKAHAVSEYEDTQSENVMARLAGADPANADEYVVMVAHLDHIGVKADAKPGEDAINNGALDNAAGVATMLEAARMFTMADNKPDRSILFIAVTGEEMGLLGSQYYVANPTVPLDNIVANISLDMPVPLYDFTDVVAFGAEHGSISDYVRAAGKGMGISLSPDPMPEQGIFTRSDHYSFAKAGIPSILLFTGYANGGEDIWEDFFAHRYHQVGDDLSQDFHWDALARYGALNYRIANQIAEDDARPLWYQGDFFAEAFDPDGQRAPALGN